MPVEKKSETATRPKAWIVSSASHSGFEDELVAILGEAIRVDGAIRVFEPKQSSTSGKTPIPALFSSTRDSFLKNKGDFPGAWFVEVVSHPRMVTASREGIEFLLRHTPPERREALVAGASDHYRPVLLEIWKKMAQPGEEDMLKSSIREHFGEWLMADAGAAGNDATLEAYKRSLAEELAFSWSEASSEEARKRLSYFLRLVGAQTLEEKGALVTFTGLKHKSMSALFKGDEARVINPGWVWPGPDDTPQYLVKAEVTTAE